MSTRTKFVLYVGAVSSVVLLIWLATLAPYVLAVREQRKWIDTVFVPFRDFQARLLYNGFGVFILEFDSYSLLDDSNCGRLLLLNQLPEKYNLTVMIETHGITDASVDTLAKLSSVDTLFVDKSGMTPEGVARLEALVPDGVLAHYTQENTEDDGTRRSRGTGKDKRLH